MKWKKYLSLVLVATTLLGCSCAPSKEAEKQSTESEQKSSQSASCSQASESTSEDQPQSENEKEVTFAPSESGSQVNQNTQPASDPLASYDPLDVEYARIWLQLGPNQDVEAINVHIIPQGTLINPYLANGAKYPETVTQLAGNRLVDGVVTYSSNQDGTINLYNIPLRFDLPDFSAIPESTYIHETYKMAQTTQHIAVDPNQPDQVIQTIQKLHR
ncbi:MULTISPECIES: hypothetical protein [Aerococcus]|uniref:hypothetical protein n=1 Tax=Aerococcus TaxID=1375 RepID=UPI000DCF2A57|nr:hypothetical protein [Aerococcus urinae]RAV94339.1 hypothetical protein DBT53_05895 [Aerococcus mictus]MDK6375326.1 hypothetical protein [Aerococcus urinae]MDK6421959.1 hypothetical protein [Aerococcus urinae]MDK8075667.1 hypothetical protein [Aerococcus urinae]MDK8084564.1 hypothetical protein [Aerococcus urinae]